MSVKVCCLQTVFFTQKGLGLSDIQVTMVDLGEYTQIIMWKFVSQVSQWIKA